MQKKIWRPIFFLLCLSLVAVIPVEASHKQHPSLSFSAKTKGPGTVIWGIVGIPDGEELIFGEYEDHGGLSKSKFNLQGRSPYIYEDVSGEDRYWFSEAKGSGYLSAKWDDHYLKIQIKVRETAGAYIERGDFGFLVVGVNLEAEEGDLPSLFDPQEATMTFKGKYDHERISGSINGFLTTEFFIVNLWIDNLGTYVGFYWSKFETDIPIGDPTNPIAIIHVSKVRYLKLRIRFLSGKKDNA